MSCGGYARKTKNLCKSHRWVKWCAGCHCLVILSEMTMCEQIWELPFSMPAPRFHFLGSGVFFCCCYFNPHPHLTPINLSNLMVDLLVVCSKSTFVPSLERILVARQCQNSVNKQTSTAPINRSTPSSFAATAPLQAHSEEGRARRRIYIFLYLSPG